MRHHERWDGKGYPLGLSKEDIPLEDRIVSLADTFDAMSNDRPYRKAMNHQEVIEEIIRNASFNKKHHFIRYFCNRAKKRHFKPCIGIYRASVYERHIEKLRLHHHKIPS